MAGTHPLHLEELHRYVPEAIQNRGGGGGGEGGGGGGEGCGGSGVGDCGGRSQGCVDSMIQRGIYLI